MHLVNARKKNFEQLSIRRPHLGTWFLKLRGKHPQKIVNWRGLSIKQDLEMNSEDLQHIITSVSQTTFFHHVPPPILHLRYNCLTACLRARLVLDPSRLESGIHIGDIIETHKFYLFN